MKRPKCKPRGTNKRSRNCTKKTQPTPKQVKGGSQRQDA